MKTLVKYSSKNRGVHLSISRFLFGTNSRQRWGVCTMHQIHWHDLAFHYKTTVLAHIVQPRHITVCVLLYKEWSITPANKIKLVKSEVGVPREPWNVLWWDALWHCYSPKLPFAKERCLSFAQCTVFVPSPLYLSAKNLHDVTNDTAWRTTTLEWHHFLNSIPIDKTIVQQRTCLPKTPVMESIAANRFCQQKNIHDVTSAMPNDTALRTTTIEWHQWHPFLKIIPVEKKMKIMFRKTEYSIVYRKVFKTHVIPVMVSFP